MFLVPNVQSEKRSSGQSGGLGLGGRRVHRIFGNNIPDGPSSFDADQQEPAENEGHSELGGELKGLSRSERKSVLQVAAARDPNDLKLFTRWVLNNVQRSQSAQTALTMEKDLFLRRGTKERPQNDV